ncbi:MAG: hypothetical protein ABH914_01740 [Candidatus Omnitrophota bacterium]
MTTAGAGQSSAIYNITSTISQPTPLCDLNTGYIAGVSFRLYPGYLSNLHTRIIVQYGLAVQDSAADLDSNENTQVAGVYFPLNLTAYDGFGYTARSDSGSELNLSRSPSILNFQSALFTLTAGQASTNVYETAAGTYSLTVTAADSRAKSGSLNLQNLEIKPAWINNYTLSASSPQKQGTVWSERVFSWDAYGNLVKAWDYLTTHFTAADIGVQESTDYSPLCSLEFYPDLNLTNPASTMNYTLDKPEGRAFAYMIANDAGNAQVQLQGQAYNYALGADNPGSIVPFSAKSNPVVIMPINWLVDAQFVYDYDNGELKASGWLEKDGDLVVSGMEGATLYIYDTQGILLNTLPGALDGQSVYQFSWPAANLTGQTYFTRLSITYASVPRVSNFSFNIDPTYQFTQTINSELLVKTPEVETAFDQIDQAFTDDLIPDAQQISSDAAKILVASEKTIPSQIDTARDSLIGTARGRIFNTTLSMQQGKEYMVNFQTYSGISPVLDVYGPDGELLLESQLMSEIENSGVYKAQLTPATNWQDGNYTFVCSEPTHGTMDALSILMAAYGLEKIGSDVSSILGSTSDIQGFKDLTTEIEDSFNSVRAQIEELVNESISVVDEVFFSMTDTTDLDDKRTPAEKIFDSLLKVKKGLLVSGLIPPPVLENIITLDKSRVTDLDYLKRKFVQVQALIDLHYQILDNLANKPIIVIWYEFR